MAQIRKNIRIKWLASNDRAGRFSRNYAWNQIENYLENKKRIYAAMAIAPLVAASLVAPLLHGAFRWLEVGVFGVSGFWFALMQVILRSGAASNVMGTDGEVSTAEVMRTFRRRGWRLINDVKVHKTYGIDHVAIGPAGVLIMETKWARDSWPIGGGFDKEMTQTLNKAIWQANRGREEFEEKFMQFLDGVTVQAICVLWSAYYPPKVKRSTTVKGVEVLIGPELSGWIKKQNNHALDKSEIDRIWREVDKFVAKRDAEESANGKVYRPTLVSLLVDSALTPIAEIGEGLLIAFVGLSVIGHLRPDWLLASSVVFAISGILLRRRQSLRRFSLGWLGSSMTYCLAFFGIWVQHALIR